MVVELPSTFTPEAVTDYVLAVLEESGNNPYIGEPISQLQHSLQCAAQAASASPAVDEETQLAALLHDLGQFVPARDLNRLIGERAEILGGIDASESVGRTGHDTQGGKFLRALGFSPKVARLVASHVEAKRYLCAVDATYHDKLSDASKKSLKYQGGPMAGEQLREFGANPWCGDMCRLRVWDDEAKVEGLEVRGLDTWKDMMQRHLQNQVAV
ncbi:hypothetical protein VHEMI08433 [[Torrubiella] hemipterigena]|uniref:HD domain-containing protein n=1 Tax=[Torrubiella] hemipterigena TaxID=1531966 RepID=A0A0A1TNH3_9HYPO|nr:hypothetical protein VHEMI08433 [[Torrubiella] hemipterigena]